MQAEYWHKRWHENNIAFDQANAHPQLVRHYPLLNLPAKPRVFVPLCGKSRDIDWLLDQGAHVIGCELSAIAIDQLFARLGLDASERTIEHNRATITHRYSHNLDVFIGDIFALSPTHLGHIDAIYDRGALIALPPVMRVRYASHLRHLTHNASQLLICFTYDQQLLNGPPFSVPYTELVSYYADTYRLTQLAQTPFQLKQTYPATEEVWLLLNTP